MERKPAGEQPSPRMILLRTALTFGMGMAVRIYLLGVLLGGWLDRRWGTGPWLMVTGVLLAVFMGFWRLIVDLQQWERAEAAAQAARRQQAGKEPSPPPAGDGKK